MNLRVTMLSMVVAMALGCGATVDAGATKDRPNIVVILADDLGWVDHSVDAANGGHASAFYQTPNLRRLAGEGMCLTSAYTAPNCAPTRGMYVSGQYMTRTRIYNVGNLNRGKKDVMLRGPEQNEDVPAALTTIYERLRNAGYRTAHFGKFHVGGHEGGESTLPANAGVDENFGGNKQGNPGSYWPKDGVYHKSVGPELDRYAGAYDRAYLDGYKTYINSTDDRPADSQIGKPKHLGDAMSQAAVEYIARHHDGDKPFYMQFNPYLVHTPIQARPDLKAKYQQKKGAGGTDPRGHVNPDYAAMVTQLDQQVGRIMHALHDPNGDGDRSDSIADKTLVLFTSDNGGVGFVTRNTPLKGHKGMFTEGGTRVPLIAWMPGTIKAGTTSDALVNSVDYYVTLADFAGPDRTGATQVLDGVSLKPVLTGKGATRKKDTIYWHFPGYLDNRAQPCSVILKEVDDKRYKLLFFYEQRNYVMYNISDDIGEANDLLDTDAERKRHAALARSLSAQLIGWLDETGAIYPSYKQGPDAGQPVPAPTPYEG